MEMPPYRMPSLRSVGLSVWEACRTFLRKVGKIILVTTVLLWLLLNLPARGPAETAGGRGRHRQHAAISAYVIDHS